MALLATACGAFLAAQAGAIAAGLPGLHLFPRSTPRWLAVMPALLAMVAFGWARVVQSPGMSAAGTAVGLILALLLPALRPLSPDRELLQGSTLLEIPGHADASAVVLRPDSAPRATVVLCHGAGNDRSFGLWHLVPRLVDRGFSAVLFHLAGHGRGGSDLLDLASFRARFDAVLDAARREATAPIVVLGQSLGGALVLDAVARGVRVDGAIAVSAIAKLELGPRVIRELGMVLHRPAWNAVRYDSVMRMLPLPASGNRDRLPIRTDGGDHLAVLEAMLRSLDLEARLAGATVACPLLVVHGADDAIVPVGQARGLARALGSKATYLELAGRHHLDPLFDDALIEKLCEFVERDLTPNPSPASGEG